MEAELRLYWKTNSEAWGLYKTFGPLHPRIEECREEVEAIAMHTDWPLLRHVCNRTLKRDEEVRIPEVLKAKAGRHTA